MEWITYKGLVKKPGLHIIPVEAFDPSSPQKMLRERSLRVHEENQLQSTTRNNEEEVKVSLQVGEKVKLRLKFI